MTRTNTELIRTIVYRSFGLIFAAALIFLLTACAGETPRQQAYDVISKAEAALIIVRDVVQNPATPQDVKAKLKLASQAVTVAVGAYVEAVKAGGSTDRYFAEAVGAVRSLVHYLVANGFMKTANSAPILIYPLEAPT